MAKNGLKLTGKTRLTVGTNANQAKGMTGRRSLTGGNGKFVTRNQKYRQIRAALGLSQG